MPVESFSSLVTRIKLLIVVAAKIYYVFTSVSTAYVHDIFSVSNSFSCFSAKDNVYLVLTVCQPLF